MVRRIPSLPNSNTCSHSSGPTESTSRLPSNAHALHRVRLAREFEESSYRLDLGRGNQLVITGRLKRPACAAWMKSASFPSSGVPSSSRETDAVGLNDQPLLIVLSKELILRHQ